MRKVVEEEGKEKLRPHKGIISIGLDHVPSGPSNLMIIEKRKRPGGVENEGFQKIENGRSVAWI